VRQTIKIYVLSLNFLVILTKFPCILQVKMVSWHPTVVYTIGDDAMSFTDFIMALRRILSDHPDREDILDGHGLLNLCFAQQNPLLAKTRSDEPGRWQHVKLQAVEGGEMLSTTLVMRDDNLFVHGFMNQQGVWYELVGDPTGTTACMLPPEYKPKLLHWCGIGYKSVLGAKTYDEAMHKLEGAHLGRDFALNAVRKLSGFTNTDEEADAVMSVRLALAGLMFMVCESARMNPVLDSFAGGWNTGTGFAKELMMHRYVWNYGIMSRRLREWKLRNYAEPHPYSELRAIYLVLNSPMLARRHY